MTEIFIAGQAAERRKILNKPTLILFCEEISKVNIFLNWKSISFSARKVGCVEKHQMIDEFTEIWFWREKKFLK